MNNTKTLQITAIVMAVVLAAPAFAQLGEQTTADYDDADVTEQELETTEAEFSNAGALPGEFTYPFKRLGEALGTFFTFDKLQQAKRHMELAKIRLAEAKALAEKQLDKLSQDGVEEFNTEMEESEKIREQLRAIGDDVSQIAKQTDDVLKKSELVLAVIKENLPEKARERIEKVIERMAEKKIRARLGNETTNDDVETESLMEEKRRLSLYEKLNIRHERQMGKIGQKIAEAQAENDTDELEQLTALKQKLEEKYQARVERLAEVAKRIQEREDAILEKLDERIAEAQDTKIADVMTKIREKLQERSERLVQKTIGGINESEG
jgi:hypothetical protein